MPRKKRSKKSRKNKQKDGFLALENEIVSSVVGVILLAIAVIVSLSNVGITSGWVAEWIDRTSTALFGAGAFFFPLIVFIAALYILLSHKPKVISSAMIGGGLMLLSILGIVEIFGNSGGHLGGWIGFGFSWPFYTAIGFWGALVVFVALLISGILITFRIPLKSYARDVFIPGDDGEEHAGTVMEKGLVSTITDAARKITPKKPKQPPRPADETVTVNESGKPTDKKENGEDKKSKSSGLSISPTAKNYTFPPLNLLEKESGSPVSGDIKEHALIIQKTLENFGIPVEMAEVNVGPSITQFTLKPATGVKLSKLTVLQNDLSLALAAHPLRIEAPIPGKSLVGIEIPNEKSMTVRLRAMLESFSKEDEALSIALGRDVAGNPYWTSLADMPHILVAGSTGSGKSVAINAMLLSFLFRHSPEMLRLILVDPKRVELTLYDDIPHLLTPVITEPKKAIAALKWSVSEMERRYEVLQEASVRDIGSYNKKQDKKKDGQPMPYIVIIIDELADLMAAYGREMEGAIVRLAQMARAVGIHLIISTQRPSVEVITGLIKANITSRIAFQVASQVDSRTILDMAGADKLLGNGDMLFIGSDTSKPKRLQGTFVSEKEVKNVVSFLKENAVPEEETEEQEELEEALEKNAKSKSDIDLDKFTGSDFEDELFPDAKELVIQRQKASASMLQRRLRVGYARAARLVDMLEEAGVVGPHAGSKAREVLVSKEEAHGAVEETSEEENVTSAESEEQE